MHFLFFFLVSLMPSCLLSVKHLADVREKELLGKDLS